MELRDYRECEPLFGTFDKMASVGMVEHVGRKNLPGYFRIAKRLLRPGGVFLNHGIARSPCSPARNNTFIDRYVFPDGKLVTFTQVIEAAEAAGLEVRDVENLREHYELHPTPLGGGFARPRNGPGAIRFREHLPHLAAVYGRLGGGISPRRHCRLPDFCSSRPDHGVSHLPLLREDWYRAILRRSRLPAM